MVNSPVRPCTHSAATTAPVAKPSRPKASWVIVMRSSPGDAVGARHFASAFTVDGQRPRCLGWCGGIEHPARVACTGQIDVACQGDGGATGRIQFVDVVDLIQSRLIGRVRVHQLGQVLVQLEEQVHADAEIARPQQCSACFAHQAAYLAKPVVPAGGAHHHGHPVPQAQRDVVHRLVGTAEFDGHIGAGGRRARIVTIHTQHHIMATRGGGRFDGPAHFAVSVQGDAHGGAVVGCSLSGAGRGAS
jgi:hypothetical protein